MLFPASLAVLWPLLAGPAWGLSAAAAKADITPDLGRQRIYMSGFGAAGRRPEGVHDPLYARVLVLKEGRRTVALVGLDLLGFYRSDVEDLRRISGFTGTDRFLFVAATHVHSAPDTLGLWGPLPGISGVDRTYQNELKAKIAAVLKELEGRFEEVGLAGWRGRLDPKGLCRDLRDPAVIDPELAALSFEDKRGRAVATVVNWACHPEALGRDNRLITADFPGALCARVEKETGGACLFLNGAIGGLLTPETVLGRDPWSESERIGTAVADAALRGLKKPSARERRPALAFRSSVVMVPVENSRYLLFLPALAFGHRLLDCDGRPLPGRSAYSLALSHVLGMLPPDKRPHIETEVSLLDVGPARILGMPAEVFPELVIGGYDGRYRGPHPLVKPGNPSPPDLGSAPQGPYLRGLIRRPLPLFVGLANDELGYLVPEYDFKVSRNLSMSPRPPGDHYEETNSIGPSATRILLEAAAGLLAEADKRARRCP